MSNGIVRKLRAIPLIATSLVALQLCGCYRYVPVEIANIGPREDVRVHITEGAATRIVRELGAFTTDLTGHVAKDQPDSVFVSLRVDREYRGMLLGSARQTVALGRSELVDVRRRQIARKRTVLVSAGALVVFGLFVNTVVQLTDPNPPNDERPPPPPVGIRMRATRKSSLRAAMIRSPFIVRIPIP